MAKTKSKGVGMLISFDNSFKDMKSIYSTDSNFDSKHINNLAPDKDIPQSLIDIINNGITLEQLDETTDLPIRHYKTQLTIHGICPALKSNKVYGYSALVVNQNKSLGVRWLAIDRAKKRKLADYLGMYGWATYFDSQVFCYRKKFEYEDDNRDKVYDDVVAFINGIDKSKFYGYIEVYDHPKIKSSYIVFVNQKTYFEVVIYMQGIYERNVIPFCEDVSGDKQSVIEKKYEEWKERMKKEKEEEEREKEEFKRNAEIKANERAKAFETWKKENPFPENFKPMTFDDLQAGDIVGYYKDSYDFGKAYYRLYLNYKRLCRKECDENGKDLHSWGGHMIKKSDFPNPNELFVYRKQTETRHTSDKPERPTKGEKVEIVDYASDKVAVLGYTKDHYWDLKNLGGGHWDKYITIDGERQQGWVFPRSKRAELERIFGIEKEEKEEKAEPITETKTEEEQPQVQDERDTMRMVLKHLVEELGEEEGTSTFEWYCDVYNVGISDPIPDSVRYEVFGTTKKAKEIQDEIKEKKEKDRKRALALLQLAKAKLALAKAMEMENDSKTSQKEKTYTYRGTQATAEQIMASATGMDYGKLKELIELKDRPQSFFTSEKYLGQFYELLATKDRDKSIMFAERVTKQNIPIVVAESKFAHLLDNFITDDNKRDEIIRTYQNTFLPAVEIKQY